MRGWTACARSSIDITCAALQFPTTGFRLAGHGKHPNVWQQSGRIMKLSTADCSLLTANYVATNLRWQHGTEFRGA